MNNNTLISIQNEIGYKFKNQDLLQQAFIRRSYAKENGGEDNEVLEFIGDKALDFVIVKWLVEKFGYYIKDYNSQEEFNAFTCCYQEGKLTALKAKLVQKKTLARQIDSLGFSDYLIMGKGDIQRNVNEEDSVKEDLFEAIIGAVALDSCWNIEEIQDTVELMLNPDDYLAEDNDDNFVTLIHEWVRREYNSYPKYHFEKASMYRASYYASDIFFNNRLLPNVTIPAKSLLFPIRLNPNIINEMPSIGISTKAKEDCRFSCLLKIDEDIPFFRGFGKSKSEARKDVCKLVYSYLELNNLLFTIQDEIEHPNKETAINQLETLARRGYF